jgi:hypothetical protein
LEINPVNSEALRGLRDIVDKYISLAKGRIKARDWSKAEVFLDRASKGIEGDEKVLALGDKLRKAKRNREQARVTKTKIRDTTSTIIAGPVASAPQPAHRQSSKTNPKENTSSQKGRRSDDFQIRVFGIDPAIITIDRNGTSKSVHIIKLEFYQESGYNIDNISLALFPINSFSNKKKYKHITFYSSEKYIRENRFTYFDIINRTIIFPIKADLLINNLMSNEPNTIYNKSIGGLLSVYYDSGKTVNFMLPRVFDISI